MFFNINVCWESVPVPCVCASSFVDLWALRKNTSWNIVFKAFLVDIAELIYLARFFVSFYDFSPLRHLWLNSELVRFVANDLLLIQWHRMTTSLERAGTGYITLRYILSPMSRRPLTWGNAKVLPWLRGRESQGVKSKQKPCTMASRIFSVLRCDVKLSQSIEI